MRRKAVVVATVVAVIAFATSAFFYSPDTVSQSAAAPDPNLLVRPYSPVLGEPDAPVTIVEFFDPACEACRAFHPVMKKIMAEFPNKVRVVLRYAAFHGGSNEVVRILETTRLQGVFVPVLEAVLAAQPNWAAHGSPDLSKAWEAAGTAGLDVTRARRDMLMPDITGTLNQDKADVNAVGVTKTPTFFVNGEPLPSFGAQQLYDLVFNEVKAATGG